VNALQRAVQRREAIRQAAIIKVGWGRDARDYKLTPEEHWGYRGGDDANCNRAAIAITTEIIEAYERVMTAPYIHAVRRG
jgi:hypothetical protein